MYLDSGNIKHIRHAKAMGFIQGVTTNPKILVRDKSDLKHLYEETEGLKFFVQVNGESLETMELHFELLYKLFGTNIIYKVPITEVGLRFIAKKRDFDANLRFLGTTIYASLQAILAIESGCDYLAPYYNRIYNQGNDPNKVIQEIRHYINQKAPHVEIIAASFKTVQQIVDAYDHGAHSVTAPYELLMSNLNLEPVLKDVAAFSVLK